MKTLRKALTLAAFMAVAPGMASAEQLAQAPLTPAAGGFVPTTAVMSVQIFRIPLPHEPRRPGP